MELLGSQPQGHGPLTGHRERKERSMSNRWRESRRAWPAALLLASMCTIRGTPVFGAEADRAVVFMRSAIGLSEGQIASVEAGDVVTRQLTTADKPEIAAVGAVRVPGDRGAILQLVSG